MRAAGTTLLFVSHDLVAVEALCDRVLVLSGGRLAHDGDKKTAVRLYYALGGQHLAAKCQTTAADAWLPKTSRSSYIQERDEQMAPLVSLDRLSAAEVRELAWESPNEHEALGGRQVHLDGYCCRAPGARFTAQVHTGQWLEIFLRAHAVQDASAVNLGLTVHDRHGRMLFGRGWVNAELAPIDMQAGATLIARFALKLDLEPDEYTLCFSAAQALPDPTSPGGWNLDVGGERYHELPHAAKISVVPAPDVGRQSFGPANLRSRIDGLLIDVSPTPAEPAGITAELPAL
jgi:hypothetical protein